MASLLERINTWLRKRKDADYIRQIDRRQESDLGMSRSEIADFADGPSETRHRMEAMADVFGLSPEEISEERWREADIARACGHCDSTRECGRMLRKGGTIEEAKEFCPNYQQYMELKARTKH